MLPLTPIQRRSLARLKSGRAIVVERTPVSAAVATERANSGVALEKRQRSDRRQQQLPVEHDRRRGDRRRAPPSGRPNKRLDAIISNSSMPPPPASGTLVDTKA